VKEFLQVQVTNPPLNPQPRGPGLLCQLDLSLREIASTIAVGNFPHGFYSALLHSDIQQA
jgi:hypothetical protein